MELPKHTEKVKALVESVRVDSQAMLKLGMAVLGGGRTPFFPLDMMALGAVKRNISTASAFVSMIDAWNLVCARTLLRTHIDTSLRFSAAWLVENPHDFASRVMKGERIDQMKDKQGKKLTDAHLVKVRTEEAPWLPAVYASLSGYIHFSSSHITDSMSSFDEENLTISFQIAETDLKFPEFSWVEVLECFRESSEMLAKYLQGYRITKTMSPEDLVAHRGARLADHK